MKAVELQRYGKYTMQNLSRLFFVMNVIENEFVIQMVNIMRFEECCEIGSYEHQVLMSIKGRRRDIDYCIADIVAALNAANIITAASCCGHGKMDAIISLEDGREIRIKNVERSR